MKLWEFNDLQNSHHQIFFRLHFSSEGGRWHPIVNFSSEGGRWHPIVNFSKGV